MAIDDGGPVYPLNTTNESNGGAFDPHPGLSLRDYLIAHAPAEPQPWFDPVMPTPRPEPIGNESTTDYLRRPDVRTWDWEQEKQRYIQWPAAWADEQLKLRSKRNG